MNLYFFSCIKADFKNGSVWELGKNMKMVTKMEILTTVGGTTPSTTVYQDKGKDLGEDHLTFNYFSDNMIVAILAFLLTLVSVIAIVIGLCYFLKLDPEVVIG